MRTTAERVSEQRVREMLRTRGMRCTTPRLRVLDVLVEADEHLSATQIHDQLSDRAQALDSSIDLATVYRTLDLLGELQLVHAIAQPDQPARYGLTDRPHHHAICTSCGQVTEIDAELLSAAVGVAAQVSHHRLAAHSSLEVRGECPLCQARAAAIAGMTRAE